MSGAHHIDISIIIVSYNTLKLTKQCLNSIFRHKTALSLEVLIVDNASIDESVAMIRKDFPQVRLIQNKENVGFSKANNQALKIAQGNTLLLLNSDCELQKQVLDRTFECLFSVPEIGAVTAKLVLPNGKIDPACRRSFPTPWVAFTRFSGLSTLFPQNPKFARYNLTYLPEDQEIEVEVMSGAFMLVKKEAVERVGLLDERFFMYGEDVDWCYRLKQAGYRLVYDPQTQVIHHKSASSGGRRHPKIVFEFHRAMWLFYQKNLRSQYSQFTTQLVWLGIWGHYQGERLLSFFMR